MYLNIPVIFSSYIVYLFVYSEPHGTVNNTRMQGSA